MNRKVLHDQRWFDTDEAAVIAENPECTVYRTRKNGYVVKHRNGPGDAWKWEALTDIEAVKEMLKHGLTVPHSLERFLDQLEV